MCDAEVCECHRTGRRPIIDPRGASLPLVPPRVPYWDDVVEDQP